jgi:uncharacterized protein
MNSPVYFEIQAEQPAMAVDFYKEVFGWAFEKDEHLPIEYYRITTEGIRGAILKRPVKTPPMEFGTNAFTCSMEVKDFDATAKKILALGGIEAMSKFAIPGKCWQGYFVDIDHNVFGIFQVDEQAK